MAGWRIKLAMAYSWGRMHGRETKIDAVHTCMHAIVCAIFFEVRDLLFSMTLIK